MDCQQQNPSDTETFFRGFNRKATRQRVPINGSIELTHRCGFSCIHCYLGNRVQRIDASVNELGQEAWQRIIDDIAAAGCLFLLFTGGDPLLRPDFVDLYSHARQRGLLTTVFTNGYDISDRIIEIFKMFPPQAVEISVYGATAATYASVTGRSDAFAKCMGNIKRLINHGISVKLKTVLMTKNIHEFEAIQKNAADLGVQFRHDAAIAPCLDGDKSPLLFRISPAEAVARELSSVKRLAVWKKYAKRMKQVPFSDVMYDCGAGASSFHIDPFGRLQPCMMANDIQYSLITGDFMDGWRKVIPKVREMKIPSDFVCGSCESRFFCGYCPAFFRLETGSATKVSEYLCTIGHLMSKRLKEA